MKIYTIMMQENEEDQLISFDLDIERVTEALRVCGKWDFSEVLWPLAAFERHPWTETLPTDGFASKELRDRHTDGVFGESEVDTHPGVDLSNSLLSVVHVGANSTIHIEMRGGPAGEWWSEGLDFEEIDPCPK